MFEHTRNIKLKVAYDGTNYHGYQRQNNAISIQQVLEERLSKIFGHELKIAGSGRTDAGVHAYGQVVNFQTTGKIPVNRITKAAKSVLPKDIVIVSAEEVAADFNARFSAVSKIYVYKLYQANLPDPFIRNYVWQIEKKLDIEAINKAAKLILGTHDFSAFRASGGAPIDPVRTIFETNCTLKSNIIELAFWGNGFLYHMVRNLVGTLVDVGVGKLTVTDFKTILESKDRNKAGVTAPPQGLYLKEVFY